MARFLIAEAGVPYISDRWEDHLVEAGRDFRRHSASRPDRLDAARARCAQSESAFGLLAENADGVQANETTPQADEWERRESAQLARPLQKLAVWSPSGQ